MNLKVVANIPEGSADAEYQLVGWDSEHGDMVIATVDPDMVMDSADDVAFTLAAYANHALTVALTLDAKVKGHAMPKGWEKAVDVILRASVGDFNDSTVEG